jgi:thiamine biosynthesis lipoprotein
MSARTWREWSCTVRVLVGQDETVRDAVADGAADIVAALMADVGRAVSRFRADSEIEVVNDAAPRLLPVSPLALSLVEAALESARRTDGAVDPTMGHRLAAWGYDADIDAIRLDGAGRGAVAAGALPDWRRVVVDRQLGRVGVARGLRLDLGATAKAWTVDEAARRVAARHRRPVLVEIGGDVAVAGPADAPWLVRVAEVAGEQDGEIVGLTNGGLATSSTLARRWRTAAGSAHHVIDPRTGAPTTGSVRSATVWASTCLEANTFSTAALVWGGVAAARLGLLDVATRLVDRAGAVRRLGPWPTGELAA